MEPDGFDYSRVVADGYLEMDIRFLHVLPRLAERTSLEHCCFVSFLQADNIFFFGEVFVAEGK